MVLLCAIKLSLRCFRAICIPPRIYVWMECFRWKQPTLTITIRGDWDQDVFGVFKFECTSYKVFQVREAMYFPRPCRRYIWCTRENPKTRFFFFSFVTVANSQQRRSSRYFTYPGVLPTTIERRKRVVHRTRRHPPTRPLLDSTHTWPVGRVS